MSGALTEKFFAFALLLLTYDFALASNATANSPQKGCVPIDSLPYVIQAPGCYILNKDLKIDDPSASGISITSDDVLLDLAGHRMVGPHSPMATSVGVYGQSVQRVHVENGTIDGFLFGIRVDIGGTPHDTTDFQLRHVTLSDNGFRGAAIQGENTVIEHTDVRNTGGTHFFPDAFAIGIEVAGNNCLIRNNRIVETHAVGIGEGAGISLTDAARGCIVRANILRNSTDENIARTFGIWVGGADTRGVNILNNRLTGFTYAYAITRQQSDQSPIGPAIYERNISWNIGCSPATLPAYYVGLSETNIFEYSPDACEDTIAEREKEVQKNRSGRTIFRLAQAMLACETCTPRGGAEHLVQMENALYLLNLASEMGVEEASRVLPGATAVTSSVRSQLNTR